MPSEGRSHTDKRDTATATQAPHLSASNHPEPKEETPAPEPGNRFWLPSSRSYQAAKYGKPPLAQGTWDLSTRDSMKRGEGGGSRTGWGS